ncbi:MAG: DNA-binding protein WhiA [Clostridia bacterium]|nr:DNA-binding protein WhiA [Clostridia bacterium]
MSFSQDVKSELALLTDLSDCCMKAEAYGMLLFGKYYSQTRIGLLTENKNVANAYSVFCKECCGVKARTTKTKAGNYSLSVSAQSEIMKIMRYFGQSPQNVALRINRANFEDDCCYASFLRGAFLSCGTIADPMKNYHLEFVIPFFKLTNDFATLLGDMGLTPKIVERGNSYVVYFKDSENIEDFLTLIGAASSSLELMGVKMMKDVRNKINRKVNFETANISRTVNAAMAQIAAIEKIEKTKGLSWLPEQLKNIAIIRKNNPDMSLDEIKNELGGEISRSGVNHRLNRLIKIADELN